jgi:prepilin-type processing-associated H-X9-DG protein
LLFPVFASAREKSRQSVCSSNLKQFALAILMYNSDNDEKFPMSVSGSDQVGQIPAAANNWQEFGVHAAIMPYVKTKSMFQCPSDNGFVAGQSVKSGGWVIPDNTKHLQEINGTSYKFNKDSFSLMPSTSSNTQLTPVPARGTAKYGKAKQIGPGDGTYTNEIPFPMPESFFRRSSETAMIRCYVAPWEDEINDAGSRKHMHQNGVMVAFVDGHVKWVKDKTQYDSYCDGPTWSPVRNTGQPGFNVNGDGSCGAERSS